VTGFSVAMRSATLWRTDLAAHQGAQPDGHRFDPNRALAVPRSVAALIGTNPRVIADEVWAKLLWAGL